MKNGMLDPIKVWEEPDTGKYIIIDGHNRYKILKKHNIGFKYWEDYKIIYARIYMHFVSGCFAVSKTQRELSQRTMYTIVFTMTRTMAE